MFRPKSKIALALALTLASAAPVLAAGMSTADYFQRIEKLRPLQANPNAPLWVPVNVVKADVPRHWLTISHGPIEKIAMPAMTMTFPVADPTHLAMLHKGDPVDMQLGKQNGVVQIVDFRMQH